MLRQYAEVLPDGANRIVQWTEQQSAHRRRLEWNALIHAIIRAYGGLAAGLIVAVLFGYWSYSLILAGHDIPGTVFGVADIGTLAGVFVFGRQVVRDDLRRKRDDMQSLKPRKK